MNTNPERAAFEAPTEQWLTEAERLIDEYGSARWDMGGCQATFNRLGTKRADEEADEARAALLSHLRLRPQAQPEPCPNAAHMGEHACTNRHQCWEPCGELGHSAEHAVVYRPQAQAVAPKDEPVAWSQADAIRVAHEAGFAGTSWSMGPEELAHLLTVAPIVQAQLTPKESGNV